jgi:hypothetical protein
MIVKRCDKAPLALPMLSRLSNTGELIAANTLIRSVYRLLQGLKVRVLVDSWYMRRCGFDVPRQIGGVNPWKSIPKGTPPHVYSTLDD